MLFRKSLERYDIEKHFVCHHPPDSVGGKRGHFPLDWILLSDNLNIAIELKSSRTPRIYPSMLSDRQRETLITWSSIAGMALIIGMVNSNKVSRECFILEVNSSDLDGILKMQKEVRIPIKEIDGILDLRFLINWKMSKCQK